MSNNNTLPEDVQAQIKQEAANYCKNESYTSREDCSYCMQDYIAGAAEYAPYKVKFEQATAIFQRILNADWAVMSNEITIGPELINEIKSFLDGTK